MSNRGFEFKDREFINVLLVSNLIEDHLSLSSLISHSKCGLYHALGCGDALALLKERPIPVVICDCDLSDGSWRDFVREIGGLPSGDQRMAPWLILNEIWKAKTEILVY